MEKQKQTDYQFTKEYKKEMAKKHYTSNDAINVLSKLDDLSIADINADTKKSKRKFNINELLSEYRTYRDLEIDFGFNHYEITYKGKKVFETDPITNYIIIFKKGNWFKEFNQLYRRALYESRHSIKRKILNLVEIG